MASGKSISLSLLSEYLTASPSRRKSIIADAAGEAKPFIVRTYIAASTAISDDLLKGDSAAPSLQTTLDKLANDLNSPNLEGWQKQHAKLCIDVLEKYITIKHKLDLHSWNIINPDIGPGSLLVGGIRIIVSPDVLLSKQLDNETWIGGVKFYYSKSKRLGKKRADYMGAVLCWYCEKHLSNIGIADYRSSFIMDVPGGEVIPAPKAKIRNRNDIQAAAEEIAALWPA